ncbi:unnamed protein product [Bursaphelenchus xylophilus]|uniref:(pine wood nematode) hypothetical protein n=1 Tax=Bursaphelenchus xylophilus TaxID=6326 RepID=A0A1I7RHV3_BURXY|nr:unnamed protein product [Bursaphelenchus xylophilus]CAG9115349.1 unnamed protein product [Bursaphelenchus xylophilus]
MPPLQSSQVQDGQPTTTTTETETDKKLKNKPNDSKLRQQKLPAWQPILTAFTAIPTVFLIGFLFIPIGVVLFVYANKVYEQVIPYDNCGPGLCDVPFQIDESLNERVFFYYQLKNYFQNHRRYVKSRSDRQLAGIDLGDVGECSPYDFAQGTSTKILPCGAIANSMFNDTFQILREDGITPVTWTYEGVVWSVDQDVKFRNPPNSGVEDLCNQFRPYSRPPNWKTDLCRLDPLNANNTGLQNVDFIVWMRTAALPSFRKLYRIMYDGIPQGRYILRIQNNYNISMFNGKKSFVISTTSWAGGKNTFLGIAYIVIGSICVILGCIFTFIHLKFGHSFAEMADVTSGVRAQ